jgi:hypothetical protein
MSTYHFFSDADAVPFQYLSATRQVSSLPLPYKTSLSPSSYLEFAIQDLATDTERGLINAFSNVKRAIHLLIDALLNQYGLFTHFKSANFPTKLQLLDDIGLLPIRIMTNLNVERNVLEHEYATPSKERVQEAVDVAKLLLMATEKLLEATPHEAVAGWRTPKRHILLRLEPQRGALELFSIWAPQHYRVFNGISCVAGGIRQITGDKYYPWIRIAKTPWRTIDLSKAERQAWVPIIRSLVSLQRIAVSRKTFVDHGAASVTMAVTIPLALPEGLSWHTLLDDMMAKHMKGAGAPDKDEAAPSTRPLSLVPKPDTETST